MPTDITFKFHNYCVVTPPSITDAFSFAATAHKLAEEEHGGHGTGALWFRGQSQSEWSLTPGIGRNHEHWLKLPLRRKMSSAADEEQEVSRMRGVEHDLLHRFQRHAHSFLHREPTLWEAITMAQHYGLPTRLLDWTSNLLVALYFAAQDEPEKDGAVFAIRPSNYWQSHINVYADGQTQHEPDPLKVTGVRIIYPMMSSERLIAQNGAFTIQEPWEPLENRAGKTFSSDALEIIELHKWKLPSSSKQDIVSQLLRAGISHKSLFPDLAGTAVGLLREELLRKHGGSRIPASPVP